MLLQIFTLVWALVFLNSTANSLENVDELCRNEPTGFRMPHPEKCNLYLECINNSNDIRAMMFTCDNDVFFNPITLKCDSQYSSERCKNIEESLTTKFSNTQTQTFSTIEYESTTVAEVETETETESETETSSISSTQDSSISTTDDPKIITCPSYDSDQVMFIKSVEDCSKYFMCYHGNPLPLQCWSGLHWNDQIKKCTPPEVAKCEVNMYPVPQCPSSGYAFLPHPDKCQFFLYCQNGIETVQRCGSFDHWDINEKKCKRKLSAICYSDIKNL